MKQRFLDWFYYNKANVEDLIVIIKRIYLTEIYPKKVEHHWCKFNDWYTKTEKEGWYVLDKYGEMVPWVHFDNNTKIICLGSNMITPIKK